MAEPKPAPDAKTNGRQTTCDLSDIDFESMLAEQIGMHLLTQDNLEHSLDMAHAWG